MYVLCRTEDSRSDPCHRQGSSDGPRRGPRSRRRAELRRKSYGNATGGNSNAATVATAGTATVGVASKIVGVATTTTTAGVTAVVKAGEAHRVLVWLRAPPRGQHWPNNRGSWPQLWRRQRRAQKRREGTFGVGRLVNLLPLVFVLKHGRPQRGGRGERHNVSKAMAGGASGPEAFTLLLHLLMTHFNGVDTEEGYTKLHIVGMCNGMTFFISVGNFAYFCRPLRGVSVFCLRGRMWYWRLRGWRRMSNLRLFCLRCTLVRKQRTRGHTPRWMLCGRRLVTNRIIRHLSSTAKRFSLSLFLRRERGHPPRRGPRPPIMGAARADCRPSGFRGRRYRAIIQLPCPSMIHLTIGLTTHQSSGQ